MDKYTNPDTWKTFALSGEVIVALGIIIFLIIIAIIVGIKAKKADHTKPSKGLLLLVEWAVEKIDNFVFETAGSGFDNFGGILLGIIPFLFLSFTIGITGLPTPMNNLAVPLSLSLVTFVLIHYTSIRFTKWKYFKRYIDPFPVFLPVNLLSMWAPLISMTFRMFGNAIVGWVMMSILNSGLKSLSGIIFGFMSPNYSQLLLTPIVTPVLHAYFDMVSGFIQTMVFIFLTTLFITQEKPDDIEQETLLVSRKETY